MIGHKPADAKPAVFRLFVVRGRCRILRNRPTVSLACCWRVGIRPAAQREEARVVNAAHNIAIGIGLINGDVGVVLAAALFVFDDQLT